MGEAAQIIIGGLLQGSVFAVVALGFSLVFRVTGSINLSQGAFCILGALTMHSLQQSFGWPAVPAAAGTLAITALTGVAVGAATFVPALARLPPSSMLILTAGLLTLLPVLYVASFGPAVWLADRDVLNFTTVQRF